MKIDYVIVSTDKNPLYDNFWEPVSDFWKYHIGITPVLVVIGDEDCITEENGKVIVTLKKVSNIPTNNQAQIARLYVPKFFPTKNLLISDIDMFPISKKYFVDTVKDVSERSVYLYTSDHYYIRDIHDIDDSLFNKNLRCSMCYILAKSETYSEILDLNRTYEQFVLDVMSYNLGWNSDEIYFANKLLRFHKNNNCRIVQKYRGVENDTSCAKGRIDRDYNCRFDIEKMKNGYYIDFHSPRPFALHKNEIQFVLNYIKEFGK